MPFAVQEGDFSLLRSVLVVPNRRAMLLAVHVGEFRHLRSVFIITNLGTMPFAFHVGGFTRLRPVLAEINRRAVKSLRFPFGIPNPFSEFQFMN